MISFLKHSSTSTYRHPPTGPLVIWLAYTKTLVHCCKRQILLSGSFWARVNINSVIAALCAKSRFAFSHEYLFHKNHIMWRRHGFFVLKRSDNIWRCNHDTFVWYDPLRPRILQICVLEGSYHMKVWSFEAENHSEVRPRRIISYEVVMLCGLKTFDRTSTCAYQEHTFRLLKDRPVQPTCSMASNSKHTRSSLTVFLNKKGVQHLYGQKSTVWILADTLSQHSQSRDTHSISPRQSLRSVKSIE